MKMMTIASGSSGNCTFVGTDNTSILVDVGISKKKIEDGLNKINLTLKDMDGILITHEHIDHVRCNFKKIRNSAICNTRNML